MKSFIHKLGVVGVMASFSLSMVLPASAMELKSDVNANLKLGSPAIKGLFNSFNSNVRAELKAEEKKHKEESKDEQKERGAQIKALEKAAREGKAGVAASSSFRFALVEGKLLSISGTTLPAELTVEVARSFPGLPAAMISGTKTIAVIVDAKTNIVRRYWGKSPLSQLSVGDSVQIFGQINDQNKLQALLVKDNSIWSAEKEGVISSIDANAKTFVLSRATNASSTTNVTVKITEATKITGANKVVLTFADLAVNQRVHLNGILNADGKHITALTIKAQTPKPKPEQPTTRGTVSSVDTAGGMFVLKTSAGVYFLVTVGSTTTITIPGVVNPTLASFKAGDVVAVNGKVDQRTNVIAATAVNVGPVVSPVSS
jgi:hypothetical protein